MGGGGVAGAQRTDQQLEIENNALRKEKKQLEYKLGQSEASLETFKKKFEDTKRSLDETHRKLNAESEKVALGETQLRRKTEELKQRDFQMSNMQHQLETVNKKYQEEQKAVRRAQTEHDKLARRCDELQSENTRISDERNRLEARLKISEKQQQQQRDRSNSSSAMTKSDQSSDIARLEEELQLSKMENDKLRRQLQDHAAATESASSGRGTEPWATDATASHTLRRSSSNGGLSGVRPGAPHHHTHHHHQHQQAVITTDSSSTETASILNRLRDLEAEIESYRKKVAQFEMTTCKLENEKMAVEKSRDKLVSDAEERLKEAVHERKEVTKMFEQQLESLKHDLERHRKEATSEKSEMVMKIDKSEQQIKSLEAQLRTSKEQGENRELAHEKLKEKCKGLEDEKTKSQKELAQLSQAAAAKDAEVARLQSSVRKLEEDVANAEEAKRDALERLRRVEAENAENAGKETKGIEDSLSSKATIAVTAATTEAFEMASGTDSKVAIIDVNPPVDDVKNLKEKVDAAENLISDLRQQLDIANQRITELEKERDEILLSHAEQKNDEVQKMTMEMNDKMEMGDSLVSSLKEQLASSQQETGVVRAEYDEIMARLQVEKEEAERMTKELEERLEGAQQAVRSLEDKLRDAEQKLEESEKEKDQVARRVGEEKDAERERTISELEAQMERSGQAVRAMQDQILEKEKALDEVRQQRDDAVADMNKAKEENERVIADLKEKLSSAEHLESALRKSIEDAEHLVAEKESEKMALLHKLKQETDHDLEKLRQEMVVMKEGAETTIHQLNGNLQIALENIRALEKEKAAMDGKMREADEISTQFEDYQKKMDDTLQARKSRLLEQDLTIYELSSKVEERGEEVAKLKEELDALHNRLSGAQAALEIERLERINAETMLRQKVETLEKECADGKRDHDELSNRYDSAVHDLEASRGLVHEHKRRIDELQQALDSSKLEVDQVQAELTTMNSGFADTDTRKDNEIASKLAEIEALNRTIADMEKMLAEKERRVQKLQAQNDVDQEELTDLAAKLDDAQKALDDRQAELTDARRDLEEQENKQAFAERVAEEQRRHAEALSEECEGLTKRLETANTAAAEHEVRIAEINVECENLRTQLDESQQREKILSQSLKDAVQSEEVDDRLARLTATFEAQLSSKMQEKEEELKRVAASRDDWEKRADGLRGEIAELKAHMECTMQTEMDELRIQVQQKEEVLRSQSESLEAVHDQRNKAEANVVRLEALVEEKIAECIRLSDSLAHATQLRLDIEQRLQEVSQLKDSLQIRLDAALSANEGLRSEQSDLLEKAGQDGDASLAELSLLRTRIHELEVQIDERTAELQKLSNEKAKVEINLTLSEESIEDLNVMYAELKTVCDDAKSKAETLVLTVGELEQTVKTKTEELRDLEDERNLLSRQIVELKQKIEVEKIQSDGVITTLKAEVEQLVAAVAKHEEDKRTLTELCEERQRAWETHAADLQRTSEEIEKVRGELAELMREKEGLAQAHAMLERKIAEMEGDLQSKQDELDRLACLKQNMESKASAAQTEIESLADAKRVLEDQLQTSAEALRAANAEKASLQSLVDERDSRLVDHTEKTDKRIAELENKVRTMSDALEQKEKVMAALESEVDAKQSRLADLETQLADEKGMRDTTLARVSELDLQRESLSQTTESLRSQVEELETAHSELALTAEGEQEKLLQTLEGSRTELAKRQDEIQRLNAVLEAQVQRERDMLVQRDSESRERDELIEQLEKSKEEASILTSEIATLRLQKENLEKEKGDLLNQRSSLQAKLTEATNSLEAFEAQQQLSQSQKDKADENLRALESRMDELIAQKDEANTQLQKARDQLNRICEMQEQLQQAQSEVQKKSETNKELNHELAAIRSIIEEQQGGVDVDSERVEENANTQLSKELRNFLARKAEICNRLEEVLAEKGSKLTELETEVGNLRSSQTSLKADRERLDADLTEAKALIDIERQLVLNGMISNEESLKLLQTEVESLRASKEETGQQLDVAKSTVSQLEERLREMQTRLEAQSADLQEQRLTIETMSQAENLLRDQLSEFTAALQQKEIDFGNLSTKFRQAVASEEELKNDIASREAELQKVQKSLEDAEREVKTLAEDVCIFKNLLAEKAEAYETLQTQLSDLRQESEQEASLLSQKLSEKQTHIEELGANVQSLKVALEAQVDAVEKQNQRLSESEARAATLEDHISQLQESLCDQSRLCSESEGRVAELVDSKAQMESELERKDEMLVNLKKALEQESSRTQNVSSGYETEVQELRQQIDSLNKTVLEGTKDNEALQERLGKMQNSVEDLESRLRESNLDVRHKSARISDLEEELASLMGQQKEWASVKDSLESRVSDLTANIAECQAAATQQSEEHISTVESLREEINQLTRSLEEGEVLRAEIERKLAEANRTVESERATVAEKSALADELALKVQSLSIIEANLRQESVSIATELQRLRVLAEESSSLRACTEKLQQELSSAQRTLKDKEEELRQTLRELSDYRNAEQDENISTTLLQATVDNLQERETSLMNENHTLRNENHGYEIEVKKLKSTLESERTSMTARLEQGDDTVQTLRVELKAFEAEIYDKSQECMKLRAQLSEAEGKIQNSSLELERATTRIASLDSALKDADSRKAALEDALSQALGEKDAFEVALKEKQLEIAAKLQNASGIEQLNETHDEKCELLSDANLSEGTHASAGTQLEVQPQDICLARSTEETVGRLEAQIQSLKDSLSKMSQELTESKNQCEKLRSQLGDENSNLKKLLQEKDDMIAKQEQGLAEASEGMDSFFQILQTKEKEAEERGRASMEAEIAKLAARLDTALADLNVANEDCTSKNKEIEDLRIVVQNLRTADQSKHTKIKNLEEQLEVSSEAVSELSTEAENLRARITESEQKMDEHRVKVLAQIATIQKLEESLRASQFEHNKSQDGFDTILAQKNSDIERLTADIEGVTTKLSQAEQIIESTSRRVRVLESDIKTRDNTIADLNKNVDLLKADIARYKEELRSMRSESIRQAVSKDGHEPSEDVAAKQDQKVGADEIIDGGNVEIAQLLEQNTLLSTERDAKIAEIKEVEKALLVAQSSLEEKNVELEEKNVELAKLNDELVQVKMEKGELEVAAQSLKTELAKQSNISESLKSQVDVTEVDDEKPTATPRIPDAFSALKLDQDGKSLEDEVNTTRSQLRDLEAILLKKEELIEVLETKIATLQETHEKEDGSRFVKSEEDPGSILKLEADIKDKQEQIDQMKAKVKELAEQLEAQRQESIEIEARANFNLQQYESVNEKCLRLLKENGKLESRVLRLERALEKSKQQKKQPQPQPQSQNQEMTDANEGDSAGPKIGTKRGLNTQDDQKSPRSKAARKDSATHAGQAANTTSQSVVRETKPAPSPVFTRQLSMQPVLFPPPAPIPPSTGVNEHERFTPGSSARTLMSVPSKPKGTPTRLLSSSPIPLNVGLIKPPMFAAQPAVTRTTDALTSGIRPQSSSSHVAASTPSSVPQTGNLGTPFSITSSRTAEDLSQPARTRQIADRFRPEIGGSASRSLRGMTSRRHTMAPTFLDSGNRTTQQGQQPPQQQPTQQQEQQQQQDSSFKASGKKDDGCKQQ
ncbi:hypothetical protein HK102_008905 [Quaeritorhiza haematococci]|nr:hypothetical protein HK102_008905 [Quaeritorhiza haematococci]